MQNAIGISTVVTFGGSLGLGGSRIVGGSSAPCDGQHF